MLPAWEVTPPLCCWPNMDPPLVVGTNWAKSTAVLSTPALPAALTLAALLELTATSRGTLAPKGKPRELEASVSEGPMADEPGLGVPGTTPSSWS